LRAPECLVLERETTLEFELCNHTGRTIVPVVALHQGGGNAAFVEHSGELRRSAAAAAAAAAASGNQSTTTTTTTTAAAGGATSTTTMISSSNNGGGGDGEAGRMGAAGDDDGDERGVLLVGRAGRALGELPASARVPLALRVVAVARGLQPLGGVVVTDRLTGDTFAFPHLLDVFVCDADDQLVNL
jgi:hypothetical protein